MRIAVVILVVLGVLGGIYYWTWLREDELPEGLIQASGRIEGDEITIAADVSGRIEELPVREGDRVEAGQVLARMDDRAVRAQVAQAEKAVAAADAALQQAEAEYAASQARLEAGQEALEVLQQEVPLQIEAARADLERAQVTYATAEASEQKFRQSHQRYATLHEDGVVTDEQFEDAELAWIEAQNQVRVARAEVQSARQQLQDAMLGTDRVVAQETDVQRLRAEVGRAAAAVEEGQARREEAAAVLEEAQSTLEDLTITAPSSGTVVTRIAEPGERVVPGGPLYDLVDLDRLYLRVYIPQQDVGKLYLGAPARIYTDAFPDRPYRATVGYIASRAEFTPREVQTPEQRLKMVFAVELYLEENPEQRLTPGLPADAVIRWRDDVEWREPQW